MDNLIVIGLWFGPTKPNMDILFQPILRNIKSFNQPLPGVQTAVCLQSYILLGVFDLPAKASTTNTKQYNGEYGCLYCIDKGHTHNRARIYPPTDSHTLRTERMKAWALTAKETNTPQYGVKGTYVLGEYLDFPQCVPIDYMHSILEGVFKQLMKFRFNSTFHSKSFSLRKYLSKIDKLVPKLNLQRKYNDFRDHSVKFSFSKLQNTEHGFSFMLYQYLLCSFPLSIQIIFFFLFHQCVCFFQTT